MWRLVVEDSFAAAHKIPGRASKCGNLHGHTYLVRVAVTAAELDDLGFVVDITLIRDLLRQHIISHLDHQYLNDFAIFGAVSPSMENLATYVYNEFERVLARLGKNLTLSWVEVAESPTAVVRYRPPLPPK